MLFDRISSASTEEHVQYGTITTTHGYLSAIEHSEVPYMYHHLRKGCVLKLEQPDGCHGNGPVFAVRYGTYRIGLLNSAMSRKVERLLICGLAFRITVVEVIREKYLPATAILVELQSESPGRADAA